MSKNKKALVTLAIGDRYVQMWEKYCKPTWEPYAKKHGYDLIVIKDLIDKTPREKTRSVHWQKILILEAEETQGYDDIVWVDSDIAFNIVTAPCIVDANNSDKVGAVLYSQAYSTEMMEGGFSRTLSQNAQDSIRDAGVISFKERYEKAELPNDIDDVINTGVLVFKPHHRDILRTIYESYEENPFSAKENIPLSYHLIKNDLVNHIDGRFNKILDLEIMHHHPYLMREGIKVDTRILFHIINSLMVNSYFLHFIEGQTRSYMRMVIPGAKYPEVFDHIDQNAPKSEFILGVHEIKLWLFYFAFNTYGFLLIVRRSDGNNILLYL